MKRVMIVGGPGSGKSTLAIMLGKRSGLPVFHMDHIHWKSGWVERSKSEKDRLTREVHKRERWILEGGHSSTYDERVARADTFIWLDFPVLLRLWRTLRRSIVYRGQCRPDLPDGCPEQLNWQTIEFVRFIWRTRKSSRAKLLKIYSNPPPNLATHRLGSREAVRGFLENLT